MKDIVHTDPCSLCLDYVAGLLSEQEQFVFEKHLAGCDDCRRELDDLQVVWEALPLVADRIEPPEDLKEQVMSAARRTKISFRRPGESFTPRWLAAAAAALLLLLTAGTVWNLWLYQQRSGLPPSLDEALSVPASQIERLVPLKPVGAAEKGSYGVACVVNNQKSRQFVVYVFGALPTGGESAYQVWLTENGEKRSAGTFRVKNERGVGLLAMPLSPNEEVKFDEIGITLEPDDRGSAPRGSKAFGMS